MRPYLWETTNPTKSTDQLVVAAFPTTTTRVKTIQKSCLVVVLAVFLGVFSANGSDQDSVLCHKCGGTGISPLLMYCPDCEAIIQNPAAKQQKLPKARLRVEINYTGRPSRRLPSSGKIFVNNNFVGDIPLIRRRDKSDDGDPTVAHYAVELDELPTGMVTVRIKMRFKRFYGLLRSRKNVEFPYVELRSDRTTVVTHTFNSSATFGQHLPTPEPPKILPGARQRTTESGPAIDIPVFD